MPATRAVDTDAFHDRDELRGIVPLPRRDQQRQRAASAFTGQVDLAGQAAPGASESLVWAVEPGRASFPAPAEVSCALPPHADDSGTTWSPSSPSTSRYGPRHQRRPARPRRSCPTCHPPTTAGAARRRSSTDRNAQADRQRTPVRCRYRMPLMILRSSQPTNDHKMCRTSPGVRPAHPQNSPPGSVSTSRALAASAGRERSRRSQRCCARFLLGLGPDGCDPRGGLVRRNRYAGRRRLLARRRQGSLAGRLPAHGVGGAHPFPASLERAREGSVSHFDKLR
jgi:hypothetical protein